MDFLNMARKDPHLRAETLDGYIQAARRAGLSAEQIAAGLGLSPSEAARLGLDGKG